MTFLEYINDLNFQEDTVITVGNFDGVHIGHQRLMELTVTIGKEKNLRPIVFTYRNHPLEYIYNGNIKYLSTDKDKEDLVLSHKINEMLNVPFDEEIKNMTSEEFVRVILRDKLRCKALVIGSDSRLGKGREGEAEAIRKIGESLGITVHIVSLVTVEDKRVSSSNIRALIEDGDIIKANKLLGREYSFCGTVVHGQAIGRDIGFPTANIEIYPKLVIPQNGVYKTMVEVDGVMYYAATNIGYRPTFNGKEKTIESHILDFNSDIYGKEIRVYFQEKTREEMKFGSKEQLIDQLKADRDNIQSLI